MLDEDPLAISEILPSASTSQAMLCYSLAKRSRGEGRLAFALIGLGSLEQARSEGTSSLNARTSEADQPPSSLRDLPDDISEHKAAHFLLAAGLAEWKLPWSEASALGLSKAGVSIVYLSPDATDVLDELDPEV